MNVSYPSPPDSVAPPTGRYSHISISSGTDMIVVAGQVGRDAAGEMVAVDDVGLQTEQVFRNIGNLLAEAGADWSGVAGMRTYIVGSENLDSYRRVADKTFGVLYPDGHCPPNTLLVVAALARPEYLVEIEALAVR